MSFWARSRGRRISDPFRNRDTGRIRDVSRSLSWAKPKGSTWQCHSSDHRKAIDPPAAFRHSCQFVV